MRASGPGLVGLLTLVSCTGARQPSEAHTRPRHPDAARRCLEHFQPTGSARADVVRLGRRCGLASGLRPLSPVRLGRQALEQPSQRLALPVGRHGGCFRVFAAAGPGVTDLDLLVSTSEGEPLAGDVSGDTWPVLPPSAELCLQGPATYVLEVAVTGGAGEYAVQIWGR